MIRDMRPDDVVWLADAHRKSGADYAFPDVFGPLFINRVVCENSSGTIFAAGLHRICYETFALVDPNARPQEKWAALRELDAALSTQAYKQGLDLTHASVPPIGFDKRLKQLGWSQDREGYRLWSRETHA